MVRKDVIFKLDKQLLETIENRSAVVLDTNVWIDIADERNSIAKDIENRLIELCNKEVIFCPISAPIIWELRKQNFDSAMRVGQLMELLSLSVSFRSLDEIFDAELTIVIQFWFFVEYFLHICYIPFEF